MTVEQQQKIVDAVMHRMAVRHGSSTRRDFEVACLVIDVMLGSGNQATQEQVVATSRSEAQKTELSNSLDRLRKTLGMPEDET